jgi:lysozyme
MKYTTKKPMVLDVSRYQGQIDWTQVAPQPVLVICKASEGVNYTDPDFQTYWNGLKITGIRRGSYHYFHADVDAGQQFTNYKNAITAAGGLIASDIAPVLDVEGLETQTPAVQKAAAVGIKSWLDQAQAFSGKTPMIYTSKYQWGFVTDATGKTPAWTSNYPLWVAWIPTNIDKTGAPAGNAIPTGWNQWAIWQYANDGQITGINAPVDLDILSDWYAKSLGQQTPPPGQQVITGKVTSSSGVNVRDQPSINGKIIGGLPNGTAVTGASIKTISPSEAWLELKNPMVGWCAVVYNGTVLISVNTV